MDKRVGCPVGFKKKNSQCKPDLKQLQKIIDSKSKMDRGYKTLDFPSNSLDFSEQFIVKNLTKSGNLRVQSIAGSGPRGLDVGRNRIAKLYVMHGESYYKIFEGGSPKNAYFLKLE